MDTISVKPRIAPRDVIDVLVGLPCGIFVTLVLSLTSLLVAVLVVVVIGMLTGLWLDPLFIVGCALLGPLGALTSFTVWRLDVDVRGIRFVRLLGRPRFVAWHQIEEIAPAPRREVVLKGSLWPPFPTRDATLSLTALGHFRIRFDGRVRYFPPRLPGEFTKLLERYRNAA